MKRSKKAFLRKHRNEAALFRLRKKLLGVIAVLLVVFALLTMLLFYLTERRSYQENITESNEVMANQLVSVYELYLQNVKEIAHDTIFVNQDLIHTTAEDRQSMRSKMNILDMLDSISVMNPYIHSAYLYYEESGKVYSSVSLPYSISDLEEFTDKTVFAQGTASKPYLAAPRIISSNIQNDTYRAQTPIFSYVVPTTTQNGTVYLCLNVNSRALYSMILRDFDLEENRNFYIVDNNNQVVFHRELKYLFIDQDNLPKNPDVIVSKAYSNTLGLTFVFESTIPPLESGLLRFSFLILATLGLSMAVAIVSVLHSTLPIRKMVQVAKRSNLRDFLTKSAGPADTTFWDKSMQACKNHVISVFRIASPTEMEDFLGQVVMETSEKDLDCQCHVIKMSYDTIAIIFGNDHHYGDLQFRQYVRALCKKMCAIFRSGEKAFCVVSPVKFGMDELRDGYRECSETFRYQYLFPRSVIMLEEIDRSLPPYPFPVRHERHIINNLMAGKADACLRHIDEIFTDFRSGHFLIKDSEINRYLAVMMENISLRVEVLSIDLGPVQHSFDECRTLDEAYTVFTDEINRILVKIADRPHKSGKSDNAVVMEYIEKNFCRNEICLNKAAQELSLSVNVINKAVKEETQRNFSEYITHKRIQRSKELLAEGSMSITAVSEAVGFTYPYYFIRKFKEQEGVTPGQYVGAQSTED